MKGTWSTLGTVIAWIAVIYLLLKLPETLATLSNYYDPETAADYELSYAIHGIGARR